MGRIYGDNLYESAEIEETITIPVETDDGAEVECEVLAIFPVDGKQYAALLPLDEAYEDIFLYRFIPEGKEEFTLDGIESDDEYEAVADAFDMILDDAEFDSMIDEDFEDEE